MSFNFTIPNPWNAQATMLGDPGYDYSKLVTLPGLFAPGSAQSSNVVATPADFGQFAKGMADASTKQFFSTSPASDSTKSAQPDSIAAAVKGAGTLMSIFGGINTAVGQFYAAKTQQYQMQSQASSLQFQAGMDAINAHGAEMNAQSIQEAGKTQVEQYTMRAGQEQAASTAATAARGIDLSSESAVDQRASNDLVKQIDVMTINSNATRAAWAQRAQATNYSNQSLLAGVSASNMLESANTVSPGLAFTTSLVNSATSIASKWDWKS